MKPIEMAFNKFSPSLLDIVKRGDKDMVIIDHFHQPVKYKEIYYKGKKIK